MVVKTDDTRVGEVLVLGASDLHLALPLDECLAALDDAFHGSDADAVQSFVGGAVARQGRIHVKAAMSAGAQPVFVAKINANFPGNPASNGRPTIQGIAAVFDASDGRVLALLDSSALTIIRTAAATGLAARHLARPEAARLALIGCGAQARAQLDAVRLVRPIESVRLYDTDGRAALALATALSDDLDVRAVDSLRTAVEAADVIITSTSSRRAFLGVDHVVPGAFIAAVGADNPDKQEIEPALVARSLLVVDDVDQCAKSGDLHHALAAGVVDRSHVAGTLRDLVRDPDRFAWRPGRTTLFDSTGIPIEDVAGAVRAVTRARSRGLGRALSLA